MNTKEHAQKYDGAFYSALPAPTRDPIQIHIPSPELYAHMETLEYLATQADSILELGPFLGTGSTLAFRAAWERKEPDERGPWVTVDIVDHMIPCLKPACEDWSLVVGDSTSQATFKQVQAIMDRDRLLGHTFDLIFIDTVHTKEHLAKELELWRFLSHPKTTWVFHDTWMLGQYNEMTDAIKEFAEKNKGWEFQELSRECNGLGALVPV